MTVTKKRKTTYERFSEFHVENPNVYHALVALAERAKAKGMNRTGINFLSELLRWEYWIATTPDRNSEYKLCNDYRPHYARLIVRQRPDLADMFVLRQLRAA